ncbi:MAG: adenosylhomocysteinase [Euryarchaeota archaeon]|nr:adenosylhomocysteinase [Euryarchaeota archaeon]
MLKNPRLAAEGRRRIDYVSGRMPVLERVRREFQRGRPLRGLRVVACLHVTVETANLIRTLRAGGAQVAVTGSNPLSTQDDIAAALAREGVHTYAFRGQSQRDYYRCIQAALDIRPQVVLDDGADVIATLHHERQDLLEGVVGACEETTTGVVRLRALEAQGRLRFPVLAVNDAETKMMFDNRYGTGQSTLHGVMNATNILFAGRAVVVAGYGWCGRGIASRARGLGANVIVVEVHPRKALEALMDGYRVMPMSEAAPLGEVFITATGDTSVLRAEHFRRMPDGAILSNAGHFNVEVDIAALRRASRRVRTIRENLVEFTLRGGRRLYLLADGRLVNLAAAQGHPPEVMDMSFANQALGVRYLAQRRGELEPRVYPIPHDIDDQVARLKLATLGVRTETLTRQQEKYLSSWELGT